MINVPVHNSYQKIIALARIVQYVIVAAVVVALGPVFEGDTGSYLNLDIIVSPGYPSFLYPFKKIFGIENFGMYVVLVQLGVNFLAIYYTVRFFRHKFHLQGILILGMEVILLAPLWIFEYLIANRIVSEGLAYPGFLMVVVFFLSTLFAKSKKNYLFFILSLMLLILIRAQFNFMLPVGIFMFFMLWVRKKNTRYLIPALLGLMLIPPVTLLIEKTYHYAVRGIFHETSNTGVQLMVLPFFVSDARDFEIFDNKRVQEYFTFLHQEASKRELLDDFYKNNFNDNVYRHLHYSYAKLSFGVLSVKGREFLSPMNPDSAPAIVKNNDFLIAMWWPLIRQNFKKSLNVFYKNCLHALGGFHMLWLYILILISATVMYLRYRSRLAITALFFVSFSLANTVLVCLVEHSIARFFVYQCWVLPILLLLLVNRIWLHYSGQYQSA